MGVRYVCKKCGYVLYDSETKQVFKRSYGLPTPTEVIAKYFGECPRCGHRLEKPDISDISIREKPKKEIGITAVARAPSEARTAS